MVSINSLLISNETVVVFTLSVLAGFALYFGIQALSHYMRRIYIREEVKAAERLVAEAHNRFKVYHERALRNEDYADDSAPNFFRTNVDHSIIVIKDQFEGIFLCIKNDIKGRYTRLNKYNRDIIDLANKFNALVTGYVYFRQNFSGKYEEIDQEERYFNHIRIIQVQLERFRSHYVDL